MKSKSLLANVIALFMLIQFQVNAQITEQSVEMNSDVRNALVLELPSSNEKVVSKLWKEYMQDFYDSKSKWMRKENYWFADDADIVALSGAGTVDIYGRAEQKGKDVNMILWVDMGNEFLTSSAYPGKFSEAEKIMMRFAIEVAKENTRIELKAEEKAMKVLDNDMKKLVSDNERYHRDIEKAKQAIQAAEENIEKNLKDQEDMKKKIALQKEVIKNVERKLSEL